MDTYTTVSSTLRDGILLLYRLREQGLDEDLAWVLPGDLCPGLHMLYGLPVRRGDVPRPMLAHEFETG
jgi:hypothetical protein